MSGYGRRGKGQKAARYEKDRQQKGVSLFLAVCLFLILLSGCSAKPGDDNDTGTGIGNGAASEYRYQPVLLTPEINFESVEKVTSGGGRLFFSGSGGSAGESGAAIVSCLPDGSDAKIFSLNSQIRLGDPEEAINIMLLKADRSGEVFAVIQRFFGEDRQIALELARFDEKGDIQWRTELWKQPEGIEEIEAYVMTPFVEHMVFTGERILLLMMNEVLVFDRDGSQVAVFAPDGGIWNGTLFSAGDGRVFMRYYQAGEYVIREIDPLKGELGVKQDIFWTNENLGTAPGGGDYELLLYDATMVAGYHLGDPSYTKLVDYVDSDIDSSWITGLFMGEEGQLFMLAMDAITWKIGLYRLEKSESSGNAERKEVTLGTLNAQAITAEVIRFNQSNSEYHVSLIDYGQYNTVENPEGAITRLNSDILSGDLPDVLMIDAMQMPMESYIRQGLFEDLWPWLDQDKELSREDFLTNVFEAFSTDGKWYGLPSDFSILTLAGKSSVVGEDASWTPAEMKRVMEAYSDSILLDDISRTDYLYAYMIYFGDEYIDRNDGSCRFDSAEFIDLLEAVALLPENAQYGGAEADRVRKYRGDEILLCSTVLDGIDVIRRQRSYYFGEEVTYIGFPVSSGSGSMILAGTLFAMPADGDNPEGAWAFMRYFLTKEYAQQYNYYGLSTRTDQLELEIKRAMEGRLDPAGNPIPEVYGFNGEDIELKLLTQEEADRYAAYIRSVNRCVAYDMDIADIVMEEVQGFFAGQKSAKEVAGVIQSRASLYLAERQ